jgi:hypothetical protein
VRRKEIISRAYEVFRGEIDTVPPITLRGGAALDGYEEPPPFVHGIEEPTDDYLEKYAFAGLSFLDALSWRHYLPRLIDYALRHIHINDPGTMAIDGLLWSLRPPDRTPPRLGSLTPEQEAVVIAFLDELAFSDDSLYNDFTIQVLEEYWVPNALYRNRPPEDNQ